MKRVLTGWAAFDLIAVSWERHDRPAEDVPRAAATALEDGCDTPSLRVIAGLHEPGWSELRPLLAAIREERGLPEMAPEEVDELQMIEVVGRIATGEISPRQGVRGAYRLLVELDRHGDEDLAPIAYLDDYELVGSLYSDADRASFDEAAVRLSRAFLARRGISLEP